MNNIKMSEAMRFLRNVSKLDSYIHCNTHSLNYGTASLVKNGFETKSGNRLYKIRGSHKIHNGTYGWQALKMAVMKTVA